MKDELKNRVIMLLAIIGSLGILVRVSWTIATNAPDITVEERKEMEDAWVADRRVREENLIMNQLFTIDYDNHKWIATYTTYGGLRLIHHPDCECKEML